MKNKLKRVIILTFIILTVIFIISTIAHKCQAIVDPTQDTEFWKPEDSGAPNEVGEKAGVILGVISIIGIIVSVGTLSVIGIKFMIGSVDEKAKYKQTLFPWLIGAIMVFSITTLPTFIYNMINEHNQIGTVGLSLDQTNVTLKLGENEEVTLRASITADAEKKVTWMSENSNIAIVDLNGKVTALTAGTTTIKAVCGKAEATCTVTVEAPLTTDITLSEDSVTINAPKTMIHQLRAIVTPPNSIQPVLWSSSNPEVATVKNGKVRAVGTGTTTITAKSGSKSATCTVKVESTRIYMSQYYNIEKDKITSTRTTSEDLGFWIYMPGISQVKEGDKLPMIIYLHGIGERRK